MLRNGTTDTQRVRTSHSKTGNRQSRLILLQYMYVRDSGVIPITLYGYADKINVPVPWGTARCHYQYVRVRSNTWWYDVMWRHSLQESTSLPECTVHWNRTVSTPGYRVIPGRCLFSQAAQTAKPVINAVRLYMSVKPGLNAWNVHWYNTATGPLRIKLTVWPSKGPGHIEQNILFIIILPLFCSGILLYRCCTDPLFHRGLFVTGIWRHSTFKFSY